MKITIRKKLTLLIGILLILFLIVGLTAFRGLRSVNTQMVEVLEVHEPIIATAYEMDVNLLRTGFGVIGYLQDWSQSHLELFNSGRENFERLQRSIPGLRKPRRNGRFPSKQRNCLPNLKHSAAPLFSEVTSNPKISRPS